MPIQLIKKEGASIPLHSPQEFERELGVRYLSHLSFIDEKTEWDARGLIGKALGKHQIAPQQKWLGQYYAKEIREGAALDLTIAWIDERIGFGVWTNKPIPPRTFIGEYTGVVRKRRFWGRWKNFYCFTYNIGEGRRSPYTVDAEAAGNYTRYINHAETENIEAASVYCDGLMHIIFYAVKEIPPGTQLCYDYGSDYWSKRKKPISLWN